MNSSVCADIQKRGKETITERFTFPSCLSSFEGHSYITIHLLTQTYQQHSPYEITYVHSIDRAKESLTLQPAEPICGDVDVA